MASEEVYESCLPILGDKGVEDDERTEKLEEHIKREHALSGKNLEEAVLDVLWRFRESANTDPTSPSARHNVPRRGSPAPWQSPRISSPLASPSLKTANRAKPQALQRRRWPSSASHMVPQVTSRRLDLLQALHLPVHYLTAQVSTSTSSANQRSQRRTMAILAAMQ